MTHKFTTQWLLVIGTMLPLTACATGYPSHYSAEAIAAKVIDAETKQPLEGVIVTANWQLLGGIEGTYPVGQMQLLETLTGPDGVFRFPAWGPLKRPQGHLLNDDPQLLLFKPGYEYRRLSNWLEASWGKLREPLRRSDWNGRTTEMKKFTDTSEEWFKMLERVVPPYEKPEEARRSLMLKAILAEENSIPDLIERKPLFFNNIVRRLLEGR